MLGNHPSLAWNTNPSHDFVPEMDVAISLEDQEHTKAHIIILDFKIIYDRN